MFRSEPSASASRSSVVWICYYVRNAGFSLDMETCPYVRQLSWLPDGRMEIVPLFPFVYHQYGPVAVQGIYPVYPWGVPQGEDFFTWAEARAVLWGGLIVSFPVMSSPAPSDQRVQFLRGLVAARTTFARDFLAYGRMQRPPAIHCGTLDIDHGLAEGGWLRKIRYATPVPFFPHWGCLARIAWGSGPLRRALGRAMGEEHVGGPSDSGSQQELQSPGDYVPSVHVGQGPAGNPAGQSPLRLRRSW